MIFNKLKQSRAGKEDEVERGVKERLWVVNVEKDGDQQSSYFEKDSI